MRTYIHVSDVVSAFEIILLKGVIGKIYNIGSENEYSNIDIAKTIISYMKPNLGNELYDLDYTSFIEYIKDRDFNDKRYHIDSKNLKDLGWIEKMDFSKGLQDTIKWYLNVGLKEKYWEI